MMELLAQRIRLREAGDGGVILAGSEVVLVQPIGRDQLLAAEPVGLARRGNRAEIGYDAAVGIVGYGLLDGSRRAVDDRAVVAEVVHTAVLRDGSGVLEDCRYGGNEFPGEAFHAGEVFLRLAAAS